MIKKGSYKTVCGFKARVFLSSPGDPIYHGGAIGAVMIPNHPAAFPGWIPVEWRMDGKAFVTSEIKGDAWTLKLETWEDD